jgi:polar amino acid transport system permease protein
VTGPGLADVQRKGPRRLWPGGGSDGREEGARSALIAATSTVVFVGVVSWVVLTSEFWPAVQRQFFSWTHFKRSFPDVLSGFWLDVQMFLVAEVLILAIGLVVAMIRALRGPAFLPLRALAVAYIDLIRGVPILLLILLLGFGVPALRLPGVPISALFWGVTALVVSYAAYTAEVYRAGIESVDRGQTEAARSLGMSNRQTMRLVVVPQAVRRVLPPLMNDFIALTKDVALVSVIAVSDVVGVARDAQAVTFNSTTLTVAVVFYVVFTLPLIWILDRIIAREQRRVGRGEIVAP